MPTFIIRTIQDKIVVADPHTGENGYLLQLVTSNFSRYLKLPNYVVITRKDYQILNAGNRFAQRVK